MKEDYSDVVAIIQAERNIKAQQGKRIVTMNKLQERMRLGGYFVNNSN